MSLFTDLTKEKSQTPLSLVKKDISKKTKPEVLGANDTPSDIYPEISLVIPPTRGSKKGSNLLIFSTLGLIMVFSLNVLWIINHREAWKGNVALGAKSSVETLLSAGASFEKGNFDDALFFFENARKNFEKIRRELWFLQSQTYGAATALIETGKLMTEAGITFTHLAQAWQSLPSLFLQSNSSSSVTEQLKEELPQFRSGVNLVKQALEKLQKIREGSLPKEFRKTLSSAREKLQNLAQRLAFIEKNFPAILNLLGDERPHRYLMLLQNRNETRPTGGFIGSYVLATMNDGYLTEFEHHDVYTSDYQLKENIPPPEEFRSLVSRWFLRDSNYHPHFPVSADRAAWFLQKEGGPSVDSVIAIDQTVVEDLLRVTGPIYFEPFKQFINAENFSFIFSYVTEAKLAGREEPKKLLRDFVKLFQEELLKKGKFGNVASIVQKAISEKHLFAYSKEPEVQEFLKRTGNIVGFSEPRKDRSDYLSVVNYSIGGNKSDVFLKQKIMHETFFMPNGTVENVVTIEKTHTWNSGREVEWNQLLKSFGFAEVDEKLSWILGRGNNFTAMRVYVPRGSELLSFEGNAGTFDVIPKEDPEFPDTHLAPADFEVMNPGVNYFSTKMDVKAGKTAALKIRYRVPWKYTFEPLGTYRFFFQKQAGVSEVEFEKRIFPKPGLQLLRHIPQAEKPLEDGTTIYQKNLRKDLELVTLWR